ncbi:MAG: tetratricopeptide repeat protein [Spirochaetaceae bacterium]|nr:tetratricopeptide repeat protein [Spirochaetaceae bacterium]
MVSPFASPASGNLSFYSFGGTAGLSWYPLSRLFTGAGFGAGLYVPQDEEGKGKSAFWWRGGIEAGFRFTPSFTLTASVGWRQYHGGGGVYNSGVSAGLGARIGFSPGGERGGAGVSALFTQDEGVYPAFLSLYQENPSGTLVIRNHENAEIRDVRLSFRAGEYTASEFPCGEVSLIAKGRSAEIPLYADFSPEVLRFTDRGRILGEAVIRYRFLGQERQSVQTVSLQVYNRNVFPAADASGLAVFVSPASPEILEYAKHITGLARSARRTGLNQNMQFAVWLFEGLRAAGIRLDDTHTGEGEVQFPAETLGFRTGNRRDIGLLYAAALEASGIPCAVIPLDGDFVTACYLGVNQAGAGLLFNGLDRVLVIDGEVWMPFSMNAFNEGFMAAWDSGAEALNEVFAAGGGAGFIMLENAWGSYPPAPLPAQGRNAVQAGSGDLAKTAGHVIQQYIDREIQPQVQNVQRQITAAPTAALYNRLGILLIRSGCTTDAKTAYEQAAGMGSAAAMTNRGNLALIEKEYAAAEQWFKEALAKGPGNAAAQRGLEKALTDGEIR